MKNIARCSLFLTILVPSLLCNKSNISIFNSNDWYKINTTSKSLDNSNTNKLVLSDSKSIDEKSNLGNASGCSSGITSGYSASRTGSYYTYCIDGIDAQPGYYRVYGWVWASNYSTSTYLKIYGGGTDVSCFYYDSSFYDRSDVRSAFSLPSYLKTGFNLYIPTSAGTHSAIAFEAHGGGCGELLTKLDIVNTKPTVTFDKQGGSGGSDNSSANYKSAMSTISIPTKSGYTFQGYYTGTNGSGTKYYNSDGTSANNYAECGSKTLYAYWTANQYTITYKDGDDILSSLSPTTYTYGVGATLPTTAPEKSGSSFIGWYDSNEGGNKITTISTTDLGDKVFYARYSNNPTGNGLGGYIKDGNKKKQIVMFGFTYEDYSKLSDGDTCGIYVYSDGGSTTIKDFSTTEVSAIKEKEGRFYCVYGENDDVVEDATYYAKSYVIRNGGYIYSSLLSATGNYNKEYSIN